MSEKQEGDSSSSIRNITPQSQPSTMPSASSVRNITPQSQDTSISTASTPPSSRLSSSSSSCISDTSTLRWDHIPYEQYVARVRCLAHQKWPEIPHDKVTVERLKGGSFNRVIGVSLQDAEEQQSKHYILRIPRSDDLQIHRNVASIKFVQHYTNIPVPAIHTFDVTDKNPLGDCYMIQDRVPGESLESLYSLMSHDVRCMIAKQTGDVVRTLLSLEGSSIGSLALSEVGESDEDKFLITRIKDAAIDESIPYQTPDCPQDVFSALNEMFKFRKDMALNNEPEPDDFDAEYMESFSIMTAELSATGYLTDIPITLCHMDFEPRNMIFKSDTGALNDVPSIIDWDSSIFAPAFMNCKPPTWIWAWQEHDDYDEIFIDNAKLSEESLQLKNIFEEAAGPTYQRFAYQPQYRLARRLMLFALRGMSSNEQIDEANNMLKEWRSTYDGHSAVKLHEYFESDTEEEQIDSDDDAGWETVDGSEDDSSSEDESFEEDFAAEMA